MWTMSRLCYIFAIRFIHSILYHRLNPQLTLANYKKSMNHSHKDIRQDISFSLCSCSKPPKPLILAILTLHATEFTLFAILPNTLVSLGSHYSRASHAHSSQILFSTYSIARTMLGGSEDTEKM